MKFTRKFLLFLFILFAGVYAASPWLLSHILARQLPPGWQLERLEAGYPGFTGININLLRVKGELRAAGLALDAADIRFTYRGLKTAIGSFSLDVHMQATEGSTTDILTMEDLSLPVTKLTGRVPELSIGRLQVVLHNTIGSRAGNIEAGKPLVLHFQALKLVPRADNDYHVISEVSIEDHPGVRGRLSVDVATNSLQANIRFPAENGSPPWLDVSFEQTEKKLDNTTLVQAVFDAGSADPDWLDPLLLQATGGQLTHMNGKLTAQAGFAGKERQEIEYLSLAAGNLQAKFYDGTLSIDAELLASREEENIRVTLSEAAGIQYQDKAGRINEMLASIIPELRRESQPIAIAIAEIDAGSSFVIQPGTDSSVEFNGDLKLDLTSSETSVSLQATGLHIEIEDLSNPDSSTAKGLITLNWVENAPFTYASDELELKADTLSLSSTGSFKVYDQTLDFKQTGKFGFIYPVIRLPGHNQSSPMTVTADELSIEAAFTSRDGEIMSTGSGIFLGGHATPPATSADRVDLSWQEMDLLKQEGFTTEYEGETWSGFDFDVAFTLSGDADVDGSGTVMFDSGPEMPIEFAGNTQATQWDITLPSATVKLTQLGSLLRVAHFELPESVHLTDGHIGLQGNVVVDDTTTAKMTITGYEIGASMLESSARKASFTLNTHYGNTISADGPVSIEAVALAGGIDVKNISADIKLENAETFSLKNLSADLFDGRLNLDSLRYSNNRIEDTTLELTHINLGRLLAFADIDGLEGTGFLDISLPAGNDQTGVYIQNGIFKSTGPGHLAYTQEGVAGSNIGLQALENFQYTDFSGTVDYQSDGAYQIAIRLEGKNPDLYGGHPIVFNLSISGSLPELFEAMFITGDFEESILKQIGIEQ